MSLRGFSLHLSCGLLINCGRILIFISLSSFVISNEIFYLKQLIDFGTFSFLLSISFHIFQNSISHFLLPHFFSSFNSPLGHNISCLMIYLDYVILISFILHQELYLLFNLIKFINLLFLLYLILISIMTGQYLSTSILDSVLSNLSSNFLSQNLFVFFVLMFSQIDHTSRLFCDPKSIPHFNFFFDYMCSQINHTLVKERQIYAP